MTTVPATSPLSKPPARAAGGAGNRSHGPPENPARLRQLVGANGVSKAMLRHMADTIAGANPP